MPLQLKIKKNVHKSTYSVKCTEHEQNWIHFSEEKPKYNLNFPQQLHYETSTEDLKDNESKEIMALYKIAMGKTHICFFIDRKQCNTR